MALIPDDPKQKNALAGIVLCLVAVYFANSMWYSGAKEDLAAQQARLENLETQNRVAQTLAISGGRDLEERMAVRPGAGRGQLAAQRTGGRPARGSTHRAVRHRSGRSDH